MFHRAFSWWLSHRLVALLAVLVLSALLGAAASRVRPDYQIEDAFPVWDDSRAVYDRFKARFPFEDNRALVMVEADDLFTPAGLARVGALEEALRHVANVLDVEGPLSTNDVVAVDDWVAVEPLFPSADLPEGELARRREIATTDPLFAWGLARPDGRVVTIRVTLTPAAGADDAARARFLDDAREVLRAHERPGQRLVLSGLPAIRAQYTELIQTDTARLMPAALLIVLLMLFLAFRSPGAVLAGFATILVSLLWAYGVMGVFGFDISLIGAVMPIVVIIISISDTVHVVSDFTARVRNGEARRAALIEAMAETAVPCLLTEIVLACGFLALAAVNIRIVVEFGVATAGAMLLTWLANMTVLPLALSLTRGGARAGAQPGREAPWAVRRFAAFVDWIGGVVTRRPKLVATVAVLMLGASVAAATRLEVQAFAFDDLRPELPMARDLRFAEAAHGGLVPVAIYIEADSEAAGEAPAFDPGLVRIAERAATMLEGYPEIARAASLADPLRKSHRILVGDDADALGDGLPRTRSLIAQQVTLFDDGKMLRDLVSFDRRGLVAIGWARDVGSQRVETMMGEIEAWVAAEQAEHDARVERGESVPARLHVTGQLVIFADLNQILLEGLAGSLGGALLVTMLVFCIVLRSWRLGLIGVVPNVAPLLLVFGMMWIADIPLKPATVMAFSITLVIADDDTIQFLARYRRHYRRALEQARTRPGLDLHRTAALSCMREVGLPMFVTSTAVSAGFLLLLFSQLTGSAHLGLIIGTTLFGAVFADMFLTPLLLMRFRPTLDVDRESGR